MGNHGNVKKVLNTLRVIEAQMRLTKQTPSSGSMEVMLRIAQYVVTGKAYFGNDLKYFPEVTSPIGNEDQMGRYLLEIVTINTDKSLTALFGALTSFRGDSDFSNGASDRIRWATDILALRPQYVKFRENFTDKILLGKEFSELKDEKQKKQMAAVLSYARQTVIRNWKKLPISYDATFLNAYEAYQNLPVIEKGKTGGDFCSRLEAALKELGQTVPEGFAPECRRAAKYLQMGGETALQQSLRDGILHPNGRAYLEKLIDEESRDANMSIDWLHQRGRIAALLDVFLNNMVFELPKKAGDPPTITVNVSGLRLGLDLAITKEVMDKREYILTALALVRQFFLPLGGSRPVRVFYQDGFVDLKVSLKNGNENDVKLLQKSLQGQLRKSEKHSEKWLPIAEASLCIGGIGGVWASEKYDLGTGFGATSSGVTGAGCSALLGHYVLPQTKKVRNRYLWEGLTGLGGAAVGVGLYFLIKSVTGDKGDPTKFPVDEYGP